MNYIDIVYFVNVIWLLYFVLYDKQDIWFFDIYLCKVYIRMIVKFILNLNFIFKENVFVNEFIKMWCFFYFKIYLKNIYFDFI